MTPSAHAVLRSILEWIGILLVAFVLAFLIREFVASPYTVPTGSMVPAIQVGDNIFAQKVTLELGGHVEQGDIVVFNNPDGTSEHDILVKRVIATGGQTVELIDGYVYIDGERLEEDYVSGSSYPLSAQAEGVVIDYPYTVPEGSVWVMGDNRENSADSRYFGSVREEEIIAIGVFRYWPLDRIGVLE